MYLTEKRLRCHNSASTAGSSFSCRFAKLRVPSSTVSHLRKRDLETQSNEENMLYILPVFGDSWAFGLTVVAILLQIHQLPKTAGSRSLDSLTHNHPYITQRCTKPIEAIEQILDRNETGNRIYIVDSRVNATFGLARRP